MTNSQFTPKNTLDAALRYWWLVVAAMLLGAGAGWAFHRARPEIYESRASLAAGIDFARTGPLSDLEEDQAMELVGDVIKATDTKLMAIDLARTQGVDVPLESFDVNSFPERQNYLWVLRVRHVAPEASAVLTNAWLDAAYAALEEAYGHALIAEGLLQYTQSLTSCLENSVSSEPVQTLCSAGNLAEIQEELLVVNEAKKEEILASRGLFPAMAFTVVDRAPVPSAPIQYGRNTLVLSGAVLGFVLAVWLIYLQIPSKLSKRGGGD
ncbi:MAG: hypothetical protein K8R77_09085 [Anaerolineaceae bacterium]|nr:hypothetical protein [Anaerolineaceae bacterium]